jgi:hypothetical protein
MANIAAIKSRSIKKNYRLHNSCKTSSNYAIARTSPDLHDLIIGRKKACITSKSDRFIFPSLQLGRKKQYMAFFLERELLAINLPADVA